MIDVSVKCACHNEPMYRTKMRDSEQLRCVITTREKARIYAAANRDKNSARVVQWQRENPERHAETVRQWRLRNPGLSAERAQKAYWANLEKSREQGADRARIRRARKANLPTDNHTRLEVFERDSGICQICDEVLDYNNWHEDHIIPIVLGGPDTLDNVRATHPSCNLSRPKR